MTAFNNKKSPTTVKKIVLVAILVSFCLTTLIVCYFEFQNSRDELLREKRDYAKQIVHSLSIAIETLKTRSSIQRIVTATAAVRDIKGIYLVYGPNNLVIASSEHKLLDKPLPIDLTEAINQKQLVDLKNEEVSVSLPLLLENSFEDEDIPVNSTIVVRLAIPGFTDQFMTKLLTQVLAIGLTILLSFGLLYLLLYNGIIAPINLMLDTIQKRENGDDKAFSNLEGNSEIALLSRKFDSLLKTTGDLLEEKKEREKMLVQAKDAAIASNQAKSSFLAMIGHEIRTPLHSIVGYSDVLFQSRLNEEQQKFVSSIQKASDVLLREINDLLDFSKIEAGKLDLECVNFNLQKVIQDTIDFSVPQARSKNINLNLQIDAKTPILVKGDPLRLKQILLNHINNSIKFTEKGEINVRVYPLRDEGESIRLRLEIQDTGIGMTKEEMANLFHPFTQADLSITRKFGGTGLGLTICRRLAELMGGVIYAESEPGKGATFFIEINVLHADSSNIEAVPSMCDHCEVKKQYILLAEDNLANQQMLSIMLEKSGHRVDVVNNGAEALEAVKKAKYDLIIMDVQMPEMDGLEATRKIRSIPFPSEQLPIIALTANAYSEDMKKCYNAGMNDFLSKPVHSEVLNTTINRWAH